MEHQIIVENIKCGGCANSIKNALMAIQGTEKVTIDTSLQSVIVQSSADTRTALVEKLAQLGYPEVGNNSLLLKAKSFVSCAVGRIQSNHEETTH